MRTSNVVKTPIACRGRTTHLGGMKVKLIFNLIRISLVSPQNLVLFFLSSGLFGVGAWEERGEWDLPHFIA